MFKFAPFMQVSNSLACPAAPFPACRQPARMLSLFRDDPFFTPLRRRERDLFTLEPLMMPSLTSPSPFREWDWNTALSQPVSFNVEDLGKTFMMEVTAPEFDKDQIKVSVDQGVLTVEGKAQEVQGEEEQGGWRTLRRQSFIRKMSLPPGVNENQISAMYRDKKLNITIPKVDVKPPTRRIVQVE